MSERRARRRRAAAYLQQPYVGELNRAIAAGAIPTIPGSVASVEVLHDPDCPKLRGGLCRCRPELSAKWLPARGN